jgi:hypothetical protein
MKSAIPFALRVRASAAAVDLPSRMRDWPPLALHWRIAVCARTSAV